MPSPPPDARSSLPLGPVDADRSPDTPLALSTWLSRHQLISVAYVGFITVVIVWSSATGYSGAEPVGYMAPLLFSGAVATRSKLSKRTREYANVFGLLTAAALVANFAEGSILAPITYVLTLCLASLYERRSALRHGPGCGVGVAVWDAEESASELMHRADEALYADKTEHAMARIARPDRLEAVRATGLIGFGTDTRLDELAETATALLGVPVSMISLLDEDRQHFVGQCGLASLGVDTASIAWSESFCRHPVATGRSLIINDVSQHPLVAGLPIPVPEDVTVGAYAGIPIVDDDGHVLGTTCAIDIAPREWTQDELATLRSVAARATQLILRGARR